MPELTLESLADRLAELEQTVAGLRAKAVLRSPDEPDLLAAQSEAAGRAGWDDPIMDDYDNYDDALRAQGREPK